MNPMPAATKMMVRFWPDFGSTNCKKQNKFVNILLAFHTIYFRGSIFYWPNHSYGNIFPHLTSAVIWEIWIYPKTLISNQFRGRKWKGRGIRQYWNIALLALLVSKFLFKRCDAIFCAVAKRLGVSPKDRRTSLECVCRQKATAFSPLLTDENFRIRVSKIFRKYYANIFDSFRINKTPFSHHTPVIY